MPDEKERDVLDVTISNRKIVFYRPTEGQTLMIARATGAMQRGGLSSMMGVSMLLDQLEALIVDPDDAAFLVDGMTHGVIDAPDLTPMMEAINASMTDAPTTGPTPRARANGRR
jgi:hypothetical protein